jgi:glutamate-1-semialdehyde 2,1-aminomutase
METVLQGDMSIAVAGTFSGNPFTLAAGKALLTYLRDNPGLYEALAAKGERLRDGFNAWACSRGLPASMTGIGSMFQIHLKEGAIEKPRDMVGRLDEPLADLQLYLRLSGVFIPWLHLAFVSAEHTDEDVEAVLAAHQESVTACLAVHGIS